MAMGNPLAAFKVAALGGQAVNWGNRVGFRLPPSVAGAEDAVPDEFAAEEPGEADLGEPIGARPLRRFLAGANWTNRSLAPKAAAAGKQRLAVDMSVAGVMGAFSWD